MSEDKTYRLNRYISMSGLCSRRDADRLIEEGRVLVNGEKPGMGVQVRDSDEILVDGKAVRSVEAEKVVLAFYKPSGVTCTEKDVHAERKITDVFSYPERVTYAGRLDKDSEGLLLMTNDGVLIDRMMRGSEGHEKEYIVKLNRPVTPLFLRQMGEGVSIEDLKLTTRPCVIEQTGACTCRIILTQGVNRQIKRMAAAVGYRVISIKRIRVLNIQLANLKPGEYRKVSGKELETLYHSCGLRIHGKEME